MLERGSALSRFDPGLLAENDPGVGLGGWTCTMTHGQWVVVCGQEAEKAAVPVLSSVVLARSAGGGSSAGVLAAGVPEAAAGGDAGEMAVGAP